MIKKIGLKYWLLDGMPVVVTPKGETWLYPRFGHGWMPLPKEENLFDATEPARGFSVSAFQELFGSLPELPEEPT